MKYNVDQNLLEKGLHEALKHSVNRLEAQVNLHDEDGVKRAYVQYNTMLKAALSVCIDPSGYEESVMRDLGEQLRDLGIDLK